MAEFIGLAKKDFVQGGLINDVDVIIKSIQYVGWDYQGAVADNVLAVMMELGTLDEKGKENAEVAVVQQYWSCGPKESEVIISQDGYKLMPGSKTALTIGSNFYLFLSSLWGLGMPDDFLADGSLSHLQNLKFHCIRTAPPKREGLVSTRARDDGRDNQILIANKIISAPWARGQGRTQAIRPPAQAANAAPAAAAAATPAAAADTAAAPASEGANGSAAGADEVGALVLKIIEENTVIAKPTDLKVRVFQALQNAPASKRNVMVNEAMALLKNTAWLTANKVSVSDAGITIES